MSTSCYREEARIALRGKWLKVAGIIFIYTLIIFICTGGNWEKFKYIGRFNINFINAKEVNRIINTNTKLLDILGIVVENLMTVGYTLIFINIAQDKYVKCTDLFMYAKYVVKALVLSILILLNILIFALLLIIPGIIKAYEYSMSFKILAQNPEYGILECMRKSKEIMNGNKMELFTLQLSFLGWQIVSGLAATILGAIISRYLCINNDILVLAIQGFITLPFLKAYIEMAETIFYLHITNQTYNYNDDYSKYNNTEIL